MDKSQSPAASSARKKIVRAATIGLSLNVFCKGLLRELEADGYEVVALSSPDADLAEVAEREGVRTIGVPMRRRMSPLRDLVSLVRLVRVMRRERPDMVHSMTPKAGLLCMVAAWLTQVPVRVHTFTGLVWPTATGLLRWVLMLTDRVTCGCATHVVPEGEGVKSDLSRHITRKPLRVLGHGNVRGVDMDYWKRPDTSVNGGDVPDGASRTAGSPAFTFVYVGRLVRDKGVNELVAAFARLYDDYPNTRLLMVGGYDPKLDPPTPATMRTIHQCAGIETVGNQQDVRPFYARGQVLVFPSYREGFPNVPLEAGAMDLPAIVTDINGSREIVVDGQNGLIVPPRDEVALYHAMRRMVENGPLRKFMAANARKMVADRFEQSYVRHCLKEYYKEIL